MTARPYVIALALCGGCIAPGPELSQLESASTVQDFASSTSCTTAVVLGLSEQIAQQAGCDDPTSFVPFAAGNGITITSNAVLPYLVKGARDDLQLAAATAPLQVNSALRTIAQQYLLYTWYQAGKCGITDAAAVGTSNHEGGRAVDLENYASVISAMAAQGWMHDVPGDPVHFDHTASPDDRGQDIQAFQELWNANNPGDPITVDGTYGPMTEARLQMSPATGFATGASCGSGSNAVNVVAIDGPDQLAPGARGHYTITVMNAGTADWPAATELALASGGGSQLYDPSWTSQTVVTSLGAAIAAGAQGTIDFDVTAPRVTVETPVSESFTLASGATTFGAVMFEVDVVPGLGAASGGCDSGGGGGGALVPLLGLLGVLRLRGPARSRRAA